MPATTERPATPPPAHGWTLQTLHETPWAPRAARTMARGLRPATAAHPAAFDPASIAELPEPARRWLGRVIAPGAPLARRAALRMHGAIRLGRRWRPFTACQLLMPEAGFVWAARTYLGRLPVTGFDAYAAGVGTQRWRLLGLPVQSAGGADVTLSALDRLAAEAVLLPTSLIDAAWRPGDGPDSAVFAHHVVGRHARSHVTIHVAPSGRLRSVSMRRWGNPGGRRFELHDFVVGFDGEHDAGGIRIPDGIHAAWPDAGGEFFRASIDTVTLE